MTPNKTWCPEQAEQAHLGFNDLAPRGDLAPLGMFGTRLEFQIYAGSLKARETPSFSGRRGRLQKSSAHPAVDMEGKLLKVVIWPLRRRKVPENKTINCKKSIVHSDVHLPYFCGFKFRAATPIGNHTFLPAVSYPRTSNVRTWE